MIDVRVADTSWVWLCRDWPVVGGRRGDIDFTFRISGVRARVSSGLLARHVSILDVRGARTFLPGLFADLV